jgi:CopA family copper-resistance protein
MSDLDRRRLLRIGAGLARGAAAATLMPAWARSATAGPPAELTSVSGDQIRLVLERTRWAVDGRAGGAITVNGALPGPILRLEEGQTVRIAVENRTDEEGSIHWHGLLVPFQMDGVPGVAFPGIPPRSSFTYEFEVKQNGTYWYHSHSAFQEQEGLYGPIVIVPKGADPVGYDREHVVVISDYSPLGGRRILEKLKQDGGVFNHQRQTVAGLLTGRDQTMAERLQWAKMLMDPTDVSDVTGAVYTYLINGHGPQDNWTGIFKPGERVRLRFINSGAQTIFDVRIPGLKMTVVAADGQNVRPVEVDEFQIGNAETYDVVVQPTDERAYTLVAEAVDRSGMARATLAPRPGLSAPVPPLRPRPVDTMKDMGMDMSKMPMGGGAQPPAPGAADPSAMDHAAMGRMGMATPSPAGSPPGMAAPKPRGSDAMGEMGGMRMSMLDPLNAPQVRQGPGVQMISPMPQDRTGEPGQGLDSVGHRVLTYRDLTALEPSPTPRPPTRALEIRLTGNMERFMWGFDGRKFSDGPDPYAFRAGERVRVTLVNDTMMTHPIHLHGHFFDVVQGAPAGHRPRKHTINVPPGGKVSWDFTATPGDWAFHCHMLYHMAAGMMQVFAVRPLEEGAA